LSFAEIKHTGWEGKLMEEITKRFFESETSTPRGGRKVLGVLKEAEEITGVEASGSKTKERETIEQKEDAWKWKDWRRRHSTKTGGFVK